MKTVKRALTDLANLGHTSTLAKQSVIILAHMLGADSGHLPSRPASGSMCIQKGVRGGYNS